MSNIPHQDLLDRIEAFCAARDMPPSTFGKAAINDPALVGDLRAGRDLRSRTRARIERFLAGDAASQAAE